MAGFVTIDGKEQTFHIDNSNNRSEWFKILGSRRVVTVQVDGDELDALIWGLAHFRKNPTDQLLHLAEMVNILSRQLTIKDLGNQENWEVKDFDTSL